MFPNLRTRIMMLGKGRRRKGRGRRNRRRRRRKATNCQKISVSHIAKKGHVSTLYKKAIRTQTT